MQYSHEHQYQKHGQLATATAILEQKEAINAELFEEATDLKDECHELIRKGDARHFRKPPCTLSVRSESRRIGPKLLWVKFTANKVHVQNSKRIRFTEEIPGRKNGRYPKRIFNKYDDELRHQLSELEDRAAELRQRISFWRATIKQAEIIVGGTEE